MIDIPELLKTYRIACYIRIVEELVAKNYSDNLMRCPIHLSIGQEMVPSMLALELSEKDLAVSSHRSHAHYLAKGGSLERFFDELFGLDTGCSKGRGGSMHLIDKSVGFIGSTAIVGNTIPIGVGLGESMKLDRLRDIVVIYLGDGATEEGVFWESFNYAVVRELPCLFMIEDNNYSVYTGIKHRQSDIALSSKLKGYTKNIFTSKDHDFEEFRIKVAEAILLCRANEPCALIAETFRYREHCGPNYDDELNYRPSCHVSHWEDHDILAMLESKIRKVAPKEELLTIKNNIKVSVSNIFLKSKNKRLSPMYTNH